MKQLLSSRCRARIKCLKSGEVSRAAAMVAGAAQKPATELEIKLK